MKVDQQLLKGTVSILLLRLLSENDMYGYQMIRTLEERSDDVFRFNEGALYPALHALEKKGCIASYWEEGENGKKRKYYHLTRDGGKLLEKKTEEWHLFTQSINRILDTQALHAL